MPILSLNQPDPEPDDDATPDAYPDAPAREDSRAQREPLRARDARDDARTSRDRDNEDRDPRPSRRPLREPARDVAAEHTRDDEDTRDANRLQLRSDAPANAALATLDDNAILVRIRNGVEDALGTLYDRYGKMLYSVALRVLRDPTAAEDVLCDIFMDIWRNSENYLAIRGPLAGWLAVLARNRAIDALRRKRPQQTLEDILLASNFDLAQEPERNTLTEKARSVVHALPTEQRKTLEMAFFDGLTHIEIAEMTGETETVIRTRLRSALLTLRKAMQA